MSGTRQDRRQYTPQEKVAILRLHLLEQRPVSEICSAQHLRPTVFYRWQQEFFGNGHRAFLHDDRRREQSAAAQRQELEQQLATKDAIIAEIMAEYVALKKTRGGR